jgi:hypothetical protein
MSRSVTRRIYDVNALGWRRGGLRGLRISLAIRVWLVYMKPWEIVRETWLALLLTGVRQAGASFASLSRAIEVDPRI